MLLVHTCDRNAPPIPEEKEPNYAEFPAAVVGKWAFKQGETAFGYFAPDTEFTKDSRVLQLEPGTMKWAERYTYKFDKDELVLVPVAQGEYRFKIESIDDTLVSERSEGALGRVR